MDVMGAKPGAARRRHSAELKATVVAECLQPGASVAAIALARGLNANMVHQWLRGARSAPALPEPGLREFIELPLPTAPAAPREIRIEVRRGAIALVMSWPIEAADRCAACLRELLR